MNATPSPFAALGLAPDADLAAVRRAFRRAALDTHPDRGGSAAAFRAVHAAFDALRTPARLERERARWSDDAGLFAVRINGNREPSPPADPRFPRVRTDFENGRFTHDLGSYPAGWVPGRTAPPGGACVYAVANGETGDPAFGVWLTFEGLALRPVFGPHPAHVQGA